VVDEKLEESNMNGTCYGYVPVFWNEDSEKWENIKVELLKPEFHWLGLAFEPWVHPYRCLYMYSKEQAIGLCMQYETHAKAAGAYFPRTAVKTYKVQYEINSELDEISDVYLSPREE
jgi:hypothetical protein